MYFFEEIESVGDLRHRQCALDTPSHSEACDSETTNSRCDTLASVERTGCGQRVSTAAAAA